MADTTGRDDIFNEPESEEADDFFSGGQREAGPRRGESLDEILRDGAANDRRDESISNIHTGSKTEHVSVLETAPPEGAPPPPTPIIEPGQYDPGDPPPPIDPIDVDQQAGGTYQAEERGLDFEFSEGQFAEDRVFEDLRRPDEQEDVRREGEREEDETEELILAPTTDDDDDEPTVPSEVDDNPETPFARSAVLDEDDLAAGSDGAGPRSITQPLIIDFGDDGAGEVRLTVPDSLRQIQAGPENTVLNVALSPDGRTITAVDTSGDSVFKVTLNSSGGNYSYTFELQGTVHHGDADQIDFPIGIAVTDSDGDLAVGQFNVGIVDDEPVARDDDTVQIDEGADKNVIGSDSGADNLLANDEQGADGALIFQFTYTDENGEEQTARAGETVDTEHGTLTVNADGSWTFEADEQIDHEGGEIVADNFTYSIVDADGDTSSATQSIEITDDGPQIGFPPEDGDPDGKGDLATLFEDDIAGGDASVTQTLDIDFGADGKGAVALSIPQELEDMGLTADGNPVEFTLSEDGQSIVATAGGEAVFTMSLSEEDGEYSYTFELQGNLDHPDAGSDVLSNLPFDLTVTDGDGSTATSEININVVDDQPEAVGEATLKMEEGDGSIGSGNGGANLLANDDVGADGGEITSFTYTDETGNEQTAEAGQTVDTENGQLTVNADGSWSFTADESADHSDGTVMDGFTYTVTDGDGDTSQATQRIEITDQGPEIPPNDPPTGNPPGAGDQPDLGRADLVVDEDSMGSVSQAIEVDFGQDGFGSASLSVPQELEDMNLTSGGEAISYAVSDDGQSITASTPDGVPVFTVTLDANAETGELSYTVDLQGNVDHAETGAGDDLLSNLPVTLTVTDGDGTEATTNLEIGIRDDNPVAADDAAVTLEEGGHTVGSGNGGANLLANDDVGADGGEITSFTYTDEAGNEQAAEAGQTVDTEHGSLTVNADGSWSFESDPNADHSDGAVSDGFTYTITDGDGDTATASQSITVTDTGPEIPPNDPPTGNPPGAGDQPDLGRADLVVDEDSMGSVSQAIEVDFGQDGFGSASLSVPQALEDMNLTSGGETISYAVSDDGQSITASTPGGSPVFTVTLDANAETGELSYTVDLQGNVDHAETGAGDDLLSNLPVTLTVTDGDGTEASTNLEIGIRDDNPVAADDATVTVGEDGQSLSVGAEDGLLSNDDLGADGGEITSFTYTDEAGNEQTAEAGQTVDTEHGSLTVNADGSWSFESDPNADHSDGAVMDGFTYTVTDGDGDIVTATQRIEITDEGPKIGPPPGTGGGEPGADGYSVTLDEGDLGASMATAGGQALNIDFGADGEGSVALSVPQELEDMGLTAGGEEITFTVSDDGQSITGSTPDGSPVMTVTLNEDGGNYSYSVELSDNLDHTGANGETISDIPVTLTVTDGDGDTATASLNVNVIDDAPEASNDVAVTLEEGGNTVGSDNGGGNLLANDDVGADGGEITSFTYTDETGNEQTAEAGQTVDTENGQLTVNADGSWSFTADESADHSDGAVSDGFTYTITDGDGDTATASQSITVTDTGPEIPPNDPPTGNPPGAGDQPDLGRADLVVDEDSMGSVSQAIEVDFGQDGFGSASLSVPQELEDMGLTSGGEAISYAVSDDGQSITASTPDGAPVFTVTLDSNAETGELSYTVDLQGNVDHAETGAGDDLLSNLPVTLTVTDGDGTEASTNLEIGIRDDNPVAEDDAAVTLEEGGNTVGSDNGGGNLLANDDVGADGGEITSFTYTDEAGNEQTAEAGSTVDTEHGSLTVNADGSWSFESDPNADHSDGAVSDGFTYTITDGDGDTATASQLITVTDTGPEIPPNDPPTGNPPGAGDQPDLGRADLVVDEDSMGSVSQAIEVDFGQDGFGSASLSVPQELEDMNLTSGGETISYAVSDDGQSITASTSGGSPVFTVTLDANAETGELSYTVDLQGNVDHAETGAGDDLLSNLPVTLTVTDGDGTEASTNLEIGIRDDNPVAADDATVTVGEDGQSLSVGAEDGLLSNDDLGADGGEITSFTYTDEAGNEQTAEAGSTVDTEHGSLTVNADGSWSFESDPNADHSDGAVTDGFTYTITDGDGDIATATQRIEITDEGPKIGPPPGTGGGEPGADGYSVTLDEGDLGASMATAGGQALNIDFGADGEGSVALSVPQELEDMGLTAGGEEITFTVSDDGQSITGSTPDGSPVMTITLNEDGGNYSYAVELSDNLDHTGANGETISDIPVTLTVTDGDGDTATASLNVNVIDDAPEAVDDGTFNVTDGGNTIGTDVGQDNLLGNDDLGADGAQVASFTYTDENGDAQTAQAGETVDTEQGTLTVNADGTWSFESDEQMESADGQPVMDNFTYTITDGDGDTSTASVSINVSDGTAQPPELVAGDASGYEDNAIPLNIDASLTDTDGSERLSVTISGVPNGATLSAGTDNGDGTWTLEEGDLDGLTVTPPTDSDVDFDLTVSVTSTETATGETNTVESTFTVEVDAVADPTTVTATVEARLVEGDQVTETVTGEGNIDASNFNQPGQGFTVSARTLNADGSLSDASSDNVTSQSGGLGVKGSASDGEPDAQLGFNPETETSEQLVIDFDHDVTELSFTVSRLFADEGDGQGDAAGDEQGKWQVYDDGELVAEGTFSNESGNEGTFSIDLPDGVSFNQIVFSGTEYSGGDGDQTQDSSDYFVKEIDFSYKDTVVVEETEPHCEVTVNVDATFGDFTDGSENHFVVVEVPEGWEPQGEYVEVDSSNYGEGNFIAIPVDAEDLQASGGSISVPVVFNAPAPDADESVDLDVFAVAQEVNIDGTVGDGEITLDNNNTMSKATVTVEHKDVVVEDPTLEAEDSQGYEDNAIALDIDAGLTDTDGSESLSVTISGVPEGASLSAGTDNGDGTWTLDEGDLDELTITPPANSDADFQLSVSATSTEQSTGDSKTINTTLDVKVDAVADDTTVGGSAETEGVGGGDHAVTVNLNATFGDYEDGSENHFVLVEVPDGWQAPEGSEVVNGGDFDGLPDKQFVKVKVDNADLVDSGGSAQVSVTFQVPDDQQSGDINFDVYSGAAEAPSDGEITLDNNTSFSGTRVTASYQDGAPTVDAGEVRLDENNLGNGSTLATGDIDIDFGADGEGTVTMSVPAELEDMNLTSGGEPVTFTVSDDGQSITGSTPDGSPVMTITLNEDGGDYSYTVELQAPLDHDDDSGELINDMPVTLTVTDGNGESTEATLNIDIADAVPEAVDDRTVTLEEGGHTVGSGNGGDNLLANDDVGADGGEITSFTYTDETGSEQTAEAGSTVDTEHGSLTVNADGSWSFESDPNADHSDGAVSDGFTYTITDGDGDTATASQSITVTDTGPEIPPNDPPTGNPPGAGDQPDLGRADLVVDEDSMGSVSQAIEVDFGQDGFGSASLSVPQELEDMNLTSGGETISYAVSDDGQSITASTSGGSPVFTVTLDANAETGELSYTVDLQGNVDHAETGAGDDLLSNLPVTLTVTDGDGTEASTNLEIGIRDDNPVAADDATVTVGEDGQSLSVGAEDGLLSNDDLGADGGEITSFTYTDEAGNEQTAEAGSTVDTEHGSLTVNADGSWSFESDPNADHSDGAVTDGFTYTITDGDGDIATATQRIEITDEGPKIGPPPGTGGGEPGADGYSVTLDEGDLGASMATAGGQALNIDFGADGEGSVALSVPQELEDMGLTAGGEEITFTVSDDGQSITGSTPDGSPVMTITLNEDGGNYSYAVELSDNLDHTGANGETISDIPVTLTVTDGDGDTATASLNVNVIDDAPEAVDDGTFNVTDGGNTIGTDVGQDNLLGNDDLGADGAQVASFTYTDENGDAQTAQAGETVDTEQGTLTVNADGTWSFESDEQMESADGQPVMDNFTYTITDGDGDTSTASVSINVSDGTAQPPELVAGDASGYEDNAIPLNIDASLTDTDGSERLSVTISGVPNGATLSAGTDNGDGTWTLEEGDLDGLTVTPPTDSDVDFDLTVSVTSTETATGETNTVESTFTVEVDAVADPTTVTATVKTTLVEGEPAPETGDITVTNAGHEEAGFHNTYGYYIKDEDGNPTEGKIIFADTKDNIGDSYTIEDVDPDRVGFFVLPNGDNVNDGLSNGMDVTFEQDGNGTWHVVNAETGETLKGDGSYQQSGIQDSLFFSDNDLNADGMDHVEDTGTVGNQNWEDLMKTATGQDNDYDDVNMQVDFKPDPGEGTEPHCEVTVNVDATFGDYTDGSEGHYVFVEVPEGWTPTGEGVETVDNGDHPQLPEGSNFVKVPVSQEQLETGDGAVTVNVTFEAPVSEAGENVQIDVFAGAIEENLDGGELTTDNNASFSGSSVTVESKDLTAEPPELAADDAQGYEDAAIPLNIDAGLSDTDGSESLSVTISGVPEGASLSAGTDNGDGTWTLEEGDLDGLTITPPADSDVDFDLTVTATSTEASTGETNTVESSFTVEVDAVADDVGVSAEITATIVPGENDGAEPETVTIGADNYDAGDSGFTVSGRTLDRHGNLSEGSTDNISVKSSGHPTGFGVKGDASNGADSEIGYEDGKSEQVVVDFDSDISEANVTIAWQNPNEDCRITLYRDGEPVGERVIEGGTDGVDSLGTFQADDGGSFDQIVFEATGENSDFLVHEISFEVAPPEPEPVCEVEIDVTASFGDFADGSEQHFVFVEVPEGMTPADESAQTVEGNAENGLTEGQTFVVVEVDAADIEAGGGTVTVPVSFTGPVPEDGGSVTANVFAGAQETNLDGGEFTFDNNLKLASTSVESEKGDMTVSDPAMNVDDAAGLEDTAIPLDLNISLTDTDGSESMAITISDVPEGATLSAGTDNGNGTWTLEEGDLDGLTITPPHNSDVDFDLKVDVAVTESATGETKTFSEDVKVEVTADADAPTLDAELSVSDSGDDGDAGGKGKNGNRGHGNNVDGVDDDNPGKGGGGPNAHKEGDGVDEDEGTRGGDGGAGAWRGEGLDNDFVDDGGQNHHGTGGDDNFVIDRDLNMNENFNMGGGDDNVIVNGDTSQGHNFNMGAGDDNLALNGDINGNTAMDGGSGNDVLYLEGDSDQYTFRNFTNNQGHINTQIIDNSTGQTITVNNVEAISFGDGEVVGNADLVDRDVGGDTEAEPTVYDLDIDSALTDLDGSESLTVTLGPVPEGVTFSAGTDNGDGTWSLEPDELQDLQMTVEAGVKEDFDLPIKATSTEAENGDAESVNMSLKVELPEDHGTPVDPPVQDDGGSGHGSGQGTGVGKSGSGHGTGGASKVAKSGSGHGKSKSGSGQGKSGSGYGRGGASKVGKSGSGHGKGKDSDRGKGRSGSGHGRGGPSKMGKSGSDHGKGKDSGRGKGKSGSGHGRGGHSKVAGSGSGHGKSGGSKHDRGNSGHGSSGHGRGMGGSGHGSGQGIAAAGGGSGQGDGGDRLMNALNKFANADPADDSGGDTFRNIGAGRGENGDDGNWFDEQQQAPADDDVFGKTELEQKEEEDQKAEEAQREEEEGGIQIPIEDNGGNEADFEDRSLV